VQKLFEKDFYKNGKIEIAKSGNPPANKFIDGNNISSAELVEKMQALYERFVPLRLDLSKQRKNCSENWLMTIHFDGPNKLEQLRGEKKRGRNFGRLSVIYHQTFSPPKSLYVIPKFGHKIIILSPK
jgi:hypothetical protein